MIELEIAPDGPVSFPEGIVADSDEIVQFREGLFAFCKSVFDLERRDIKNLALRFFSEGLTSAWVFRLQINLKRPAGSSPVRVLKYDSRENVTRELRNYKETGFKLREKLFPIMETQIHPCGPKKAFLVMSSIIDSYNARTSYNLIQYVIDRHELSDDFLDHWAQLLLDALARVVIGMEESFYSGYVAITEGNQGTNTINDLFRLKVSKLALNPHHREEYDRCATQVITMQLPQYEDFMIFGFARDEPALIARHAIHNDFNACNTLLALSDRSEFSGVRVDPMVIDFFDVAYSQSNAWSPKGWTPYYYDAARLECEILIRYFYHLAARHEISVTSLIPTILEVLAALNHASFQVFEDQSGLRAGELNFIYKIVYYLRRSRFEPGRAKNAGKLPTSHFLNYCASAMTFSFFYLKFEREENISAKKILALAIAGFYRSFLNKPALSTPTGYDVPRVDQIGLRGFMLSNGHMLETYVPPVQSLSRISKSLSAGQPHIFVECPPGSGKTALVLYLSQVLNLERHDDAIPLTHFLSIPVFLQRGGAIRPVERSAEFPLDYILRRIANFLPELLPLPKEQSDPAGFVPFLARASVALIQRDLHLLIMFDSISSASDFPDLIPARLPPRVHILFTERPACEPVSRMIRKKGLQPVSIVLEPLNAAATSAMIEGSGIHVTELDAQRIHEKSCGLPLYIVGLIQMRKDGASDSQNDLPENVSDLYSDLLREIIKSDRNEETVRLLATLSLSAGPLSADQLAAICGETGPVARLQVIERLKLFRGFVVSHNSLNLEIFHSTLGEYLTENLDVAFMQSVREQFVAYFKELGRFAPNSPDANYALKYFGIQLWNWERDAEIVDLVTVVFSSESHTNHFPFLENLLLGIARRSTDKSAQARLQGIMEQFTHRHAIREEQLIGAEAALRELLQRLEGGGNLSAAYIVAIAKLPIQRAITPTSPRNCRNVFALMGYCGALAARMGKLDAARAHFIAACQRSDPVIDFEQLPGPDRELAAAHEAFGDLELKANNLREAHIHYSISVDVRLRLLALFPHDALFHLDLSSAMDSLGNLASHYGNSEAALGWYEWSLDILTDLSETYSEQTRLRDSLSLDFSDVSQVALKLKARIIRSLTLAHVRLGTLQGQRENLPSSRYHLSKAREISESVPDSHDPTELEADTAAICIQFGDLEVRSFAHEKAAQEIDRGLSILEDLTKRFPDEVKFRKNYLIAAKEIADLFLKLIRLEDATHLLAKGIRACEDGSNRYPDDTFFGNQLADLFLRQAKIETHFNRIPLARDFMGKALDIQSRLASENREQPLFSSSLGKSLQSIAITEFSFGNLSEARDLLHQSQLVFAELVQDFPDRPLFRKSLAESLQVLGNLEFDVGNPDAGRPVLASSMDIFKTLHNEFPDRREFRDALSGSHKIIAERSLARDDAIRELKLALKLDEETLRRDPNDPVALHEVARLCGRLGAFEKSQNASESRGFHERAVSICERLVREYPARPEMKEALARSLLEFGLTLKKNNPPESQTLLRNAETLFHELTVAYPAAFQFCFGLATTEGALGDCEAALGDHPLARVHFSRALSAFRNLIDQYPDMPVYRSGSAWILGDWGRVEKQALDFRRAAELFAQALDMANVLRKKEPTNPSQRQLGTELLDDLTKLADEQYMSLPSRPLLLLVLIFRRRAMRLRLELAEGIIHPCLQNWIEEVKFAPTAENILQFLLIAAKFSEVQSLLWKPEEAHKTLETADRILMTVLDHLGSVSRMQQVLRRIYGNLAKFAFMRGEREMARVYKGRLISLLGSGDT